MIGAVYPYPRFEGGDFVLPSVSITDEEGKRFPRQAGRLVRVEARCQGIRSTGCHVLAAAS
jgi:hypothetical protein